MNRGRNVFAILMLAGVMLALAVAWQAQTVSKSENVMSYQIIKETDRDSLEDAVNNAIALGWVPLGAPFYTQDENGFYLWFQAMTRSKLVEDPRLNL